MVVVVVVVLSLGMLSPERARYRQEGRKDSSRPLLFKQLRLRRRRVVVPGARERGREG